MNDTITIPLNGTDFSAPGQRARGVTWSDDQNNIYLLGGRTYIGTFTIWQSIIYKRRSR